MFALFVMVASFLIQTYQTAYVFTDIQPDVSMHVLGPVNVTILQAENGQLVGHCVPSEISAYVVWMQFGRAPMYWVENSLGSSMVDKDRLSLIECTNPN